MSKLDEAIKLLEQYKEESKPKGNFSKYFTLKELVRSETATRQDIKNNPSKAQEVQLKESVSYTHLTLPTSDLV